MKAQTLYQSSSRQRLEDFRYKLESSLNSKSNQNYKNGENSKRKISPYLRVKEFTEEICRSVTPKKEESPVFKHYKNLSYFKTQNSSPKASADGRKKIAFQYNIDGYTDKRNEKLSDLISIETLSTATSVVSRGGIKTIPKVYAAQLREFCNEVLTNIR